MAYAEEENKAIEDLKAKGVMSDSTSSGASSIVLVKKKNESIRLCVNYRKVNEPVKPDGFPLPRNQNCKVIQYFRSSKWQLPDITARGGHTKECLRL